MSHGWFNTCSAAATLTHSNKKNSGNGRSAVSKVDLLSGRSVRSVLDCSFEGLCFERRHALDPPQTVGGVPDGKRKDRLRIPSIDDVDEIVVALGVVDGLELDAQFVELCLGLADPLRLLLGPLRAQISKQHIFHDHLHGMLIILREGHAIIRRLVSQAYAV